MLCFKSNILFTVVVVFLLKYVNSEKEIKLTTPLGQMSGYTMKTQEGRHISAFTAIPYAIPPVGELRFQAPIPVEPWEGILDATKTTPKCVQRNPYTRQKEIVGQEDCLYLNIYTPYTGDKLLLGKVSLLSVMVFIHGGGWMCGDSSTEMYGPEYLLDHNVILVTINYRLGPLGFLSTRDKHCPGNNGLKDQQEALRFLQKVIKSFGGDKKSVTIFGESAGGASVHFHMVSKNSAGLFHKAISESGTAMVPWAYGSPVEADLHADLLRNLTGCAKASSEELLSCLRTKDSYEIIDTEFKFYAWDYEAMTPFKAIEEPDHPGAFFSEPLRDITDFNNVPWLTGLTKDEGCLKSVWITSNRTRLQEFLEKFSDIAPVSFYYVNEDPKIISDITNSIYHTYNIGSSDVKKIKDGILQMYTDAYFAYPMVEAVEHVMKHSKSPVYLYELSYRGDNSFSQIFGDPVRNYGVCHADELMYLFPIHFLQNKPSSKDHEVGKSLRIMWTNFAKTGNPNKPVPLAVNWKKATENLDYLDIGSELSMKENLATRSRFWGNLPIWRQKLTDYLSYPEDGGLTPLKSKLATRSRFWDTLPIWREEVSEKVEL